MSDTAHPKPVRAVIMRGGTSKAVFLDVADLPIPGETRDRMIQSIFGSPDGRQIDGLGGADPLTSKVALIDRNASEGAACTYTFGQVEIEHDGVDYESLCGNVTAAVGHYAVEEGLCEVTEPVTRVVIDNTNMRCRLYVEVPVKDGMPVDEGDYVVPGVPGTGARIGVDLSETAGQATGSVLVTGNPTDVIDVPGFGPLTVSLLDVGNPHVFLRATDIGLVGTESADWIGRNTELSDLLERIRSAAAVAMGLVADWESARKNSPAVPIIGFVSPPAAYVAEGDAGPIAEGDIDLVSRLMFMQRPHKAYAGTSTVCTGVAAKIPGTVVWEVVRDSVGSAIEGPTRIGHPRGVIVTESKVYAKGGHYVVDRATVGRTARRIMAGTVFPRPDARLMTAS